MEKRKNWLKVLILASTTLFPCWVGTCILSATETESGSREVQTIIGPRTDKLLRAMGDYLKTATQFSFQADIVFDDILPSGQKIQYSALSEIGVHRPDRIYAEQQSDLGGKRLWYDGKNMTLMDTGVGVYSTVPVPATIDAAMDYLMEKYGFSPPLSDIVYQDPYSTLIENVVFGFYVGLHDVEGVRCHHLAFVQKNIDWQIWIEDGNQMVPRKIVLTYKNMAGSPQYSAVLSEWVLDARLPDALFDADLVSTEDLEKIEFLTISETVPTNLGKEE